MKLCPKCGRSPLPFVMVLLVASVSAFMTWLTLGLSVTEERPRLVAGLAVFLIVGATVLHYVLSCLRRHCRHGVHDHRKPGVAG